MNAIDEVSQTLGKLQADSEAAQRHRQAMFRELQDLNEKLATLPVIIQQVKDLSKQAARHEKDIVSLKALKNRIQGAAAIGGGLVGATLTATWKYLTKDGF